MANDQRIISSSRLLVAAYDPEGTGPPWCASVVDVDMSFFSSVCAKPKVAEMVAASLNLCSGPARTCGQRQWLEDSTSPDDSSDRQALTSRSFSALGIAALVPAFLLMYTVLSLLPADSGAFSIFSWLIGGGQRGGNFESQPTAFILLGIVAGLSAALAVWDQACPQLMRGMGREHPLAHIAGALRRITLVWLVAVVYCGLGTMLLVATMKSTQSMAVFYVGLALLAFTAPLATEVFRSVVIRRRNSKSGVQASARH